MALIAGIVIYFANFIRGKQKNSKLVAAWFNTNKSLLNDNFALVGKFYDHRLIYYVFKLQEKPNPLFSFVYVLLLGV